MRMSIEYLDATRSGIEKIGQHEALRDPLQVTSKPFLVTKLSLWGAEILGFKLDRTACFSGKFYPQREPLPSRVIFKSQPVS